MGNPEYSDYLQILHTFNNSYDPNYYPTARVPGCEITSEEVVGQVLSWADQYLINHSIPNLLRYHILYLTIKEAKHKFIDKQKKYTQMKFGAETISLIHSICEKLFNDIKIREKLPVFLTQSKSWPIYSVASMKNRRRSMEDRHAIINDLNVIFGIESQSPVSYYGIFDGHSGPDAALYSATHLHCHLAESSQYVHNPAEALRDAFKITDSNFQNKNLNAGSTVVCAVYSPAEKTLHVGWVGDSKALLATKRKIMQLVTPHRPDLKEERERIEACDGTVINYSGAYRVNGVLAVSRAIGDYHLRPWVSSIPDIIHVPLSGEEDFLILACDGLWDFVSEDIAALTVYNILDDLENYKDNPNKGMEALNTAANKLSLFAQDQGSTDNISIIIVFLKNPFLSTSGSWPSAVKSSPLDKMEAAYETTICTEFTNSNQDLPPPPTYNIIHHKLDDQMTDDKEFDGIEEDLGPETDVDTIDEAILGTNLTIDEHNKIDSNKKVELIKEAIDPLDYNVNDDIYNKSDLLELSNNHNHNNHHDHNNHHVDHHSQHIDDNKLLESVTEELTAFNRKEKKLDFSEKREYSFECEKYEKEINTPTDLMTNEVLHSCSFMENDVESKPDAETYIVPEPEHEKTVDQLRAENVVVPESGEESEDEWNYINVEKREQTNKIDDTVESKINSPFVAESQEAIADLLHQEQIDDPELVYVEIQHEAEKKADKGKELEVEVEKIIAKALAEKQQADDILNDEITEDDDMSSQLNPDAQEFFPNSPLRTTPLSSPFTSGSIQIEDDTIIAQSPRKFKPMQIELPKEDEFDNEISKRPCDMELQRPGSSSSQCSYQEINLKEAMHDEKKEFAAESETETEEIIVEETDDDDVGKTEIIDFVVTDKMIELKNEITTNGVDHTNLHEALTKSILQQDPMSVSFYNDGTANSNDPFKVGPLKVDLNAVHQLPDTDEDDNDIENDKENNSAIFTKMPVHSIIGMNGNIEMSSPQNDSDEISKPEDDQYQVIPDYGKCDNRIASPDQYNQSDKPESELIPPEHFDDQSLSKKDDDKTADVTSALSDLTISDQTISPPFEVEPFVKNIKIENDSFDEKYIESGLSPTAHVFHPFNSTNDGDNDDGTPLITNESAESDICLQDQYKSPNTATIIETENHINDIINQPTLQIEQNNSIDLLLMENSSPFTYDDQKIVPETRNSFSPIKINPSMQSVEIQHKEVVENTINLLEFDNNNEVVIEESHDVAEQIPDHLYKTEKDDQVKEIVPAMSPLLLEQTLEITNAVESAFEQQQTETIVKTETNVTNEFTNDNRIINNVDLIEPMIAIEKMAIDEIVEEKPIEPIKEIDDTQQQQQKLTETTITAAKTIAAKMTQNDVSPTLSTSATKAKKADLKTKSTVANTATMATKKTTTSLCNSSSATATAKSKSATTAATTATAAKHSTTKATAPLAKPRTAMSVASAPITTTTTVNNKHQSTTLEKKPTSTQAAKKPLLNGDIKSTTTTLLAAKRSADPKISSSATVTNNKTSTLKTATRPALASKTMSSTTATTTTTTAAIGLSKPQTIVGRPATMTKAAAQKTSTITSASSATTATTITSTSTAKPKSTLSASNAAPRANTSRPLSSSNKPLNNNDKLSKETMNKLALGTRTATTNVGTTNKAPLLSTTSPKGSTSATTMKKTDAIKSPSTGAKPITKSMSSSATSKKTSTTITNGSAISSTTATTTTTVSNKKMATTLATRTCLAPKRAMSASSPNKKLTTIGAANNKSPKSTTTVAGKPDSARNITAITTTTTITTTGLKTIDSLSTAGIESTPIATTVTTNNNDRIENLLNKSENEQQMNAIIDSSAD